MKTSGFTIIYDGPTILLKDGVYWTVIVKSNRSGRLKRYSLIKRNSGKMEWRFLEEPKRPIS